MAHVWAIARNRVPIHALEMHHPTLSLAAFRRKLAVVENALTPPRTRTIVAPAARCAAETFAETASAGLANRDLRNAGTSVSTRRQTGRIAAPAAKCARTEVSATTALA